MAHPNYLPLSSWEFSQWIAYYTKEPFGEDLADLRHGLLCSLIYNRWRGNNETAKDPQAFMLTARNDQPTVDKMRRVLKEAIHGGTARTTKN